MRATKPHILKETQESRLERNRLWKATTTKIKESKKIYGRKKLKPID